MDQNGFKHQNSRNCLPGTWLPTNSRLLYCMLLLLSETTSGKMKNMKMNLHLQQLYIETPFQLNPPSSKFHSSSHVASSRFWMLSRGHRRRRRPCNPSLRRQLGARFQENWWRKPWEKIRPSSEMRWKKGCDMMSNGVIGYDMMWYDMTLWFSS